MDNEKDTKKRIPLALLCDTSTSFYNDFIVPHRDNKTLMSLCLSLLTSYYESPEFARMADTLSEQRSGIASIRNQILRANQEHDKNLMRLSVLDGTIGNMQQEVQENQKELQSSSQALEEFKNQVDNKFNEVVNLISQLSSTMNTLLPAVTQVVAGQNSGQAPVTIPMGVSPLGVQQAQPPIGEPASSVPPEIASIFTQKQEVAEAIPVQVVAPVQPSVAPVQKHEQGVLQEQAQSQEQVQEVPVQPAQQVEQQAQSQVQQQEQSVQESAESDSTTNVSSLTSSDVASKLDSLFGGDDDDSSDEDDELYEDALAFNKLLSSTRRR